MNMRTDLSNERLILSRIKVVEAEQDGAHPPSDGAHRLAWWIVEGINPFGRAEVLADQVGVSMQMVERLIDGSIEPSDPLAAMIATVTGGLVLPADWMRGGPLCWTDRPFAREVAA